MERLVIQPNYENTFVMPNLLYVFLDKVDFSWDIYYYRKDTEPLFDSFMYSLVSHFFPVFIQYLQYIHCWLHQHQPEVNLVATMSHFEVAKSYAR